MNDYVLDAGPGIEWEGRRGGGAALSATGQRVHAPHLIGAEVGNVLRRHEPAAIISGEEARTALDAARVLINFLVGTGT